MAKFWYYSMHYNFAKDYFFGMVESSIGQKKDIIFTIDDTNNMINLIKNKEMMHVDDVVGLMYYLRRINKIGKHDIVIMNHSPLIW